MIKYIRKKTHIPLCLFSYIWHTNCTVVRLKVDSLVQQLRHSVLISSCLSVWQSEVSPPPGLRLSLGLWRIQEDGAVGGEDLPGVRGGQLTFGPHQAHAVALLQRQDEAEGHGAPAGAGATAAVATQWPRGGLQPLHAAVGHGQNGLHSIALLSRQHARHQVATVHRNREDAWWSETEPVSVCRCASRKLLCSGCWPPAVFKLQTCFSSHTKMTQTNIM